MNDPKSIIQEYLINSKAPVEILRAMRELDERDARQATAFETHIREKREIAEMVIRGSKGDYPVLPITPFTAALDELVAYREAFFWVMERDFDYAQAAGEMLRDDTLNYKSKRLIENFMLEDAECDHSVGVCFCELKAALGLDGYDAILSQQNANRIAKAIRRSVDEKNVSD